MGPNPNHIYPNKNIKQIVYIKNVITRSNIVVGEYTYYDDVNGAEKFEDHVTHHYEFLGDKLSRCSFYDLHHSSQTQCPLL